MRKFIPSDFKSIGELSVCGITSAVVAVGVFDGLHKGHRKLLTELLDLSRQTGAEPVVMTFFPHPRQLLTDHPPKLLYPPSEKVRLLYQFGAKAVVTVDFTKEFALLSPAEFLRQSVFAGPVEIKGLCVGKHWRFGAKAAGDTDFLQRSANERGFLFSAVDELCMENGQVVSSTSIRESIGKGELEKAAQMLGRNYSLFGKVEHGYQVATEKLSTPTANLKITDGVLPPFGVYAAYVHLDEQRFPAAVNIGVSPTFRAQYGEIQPRVEIHILNGFKESIYDRELELEMVGFVRPERTFGSPEELKKQIREDIICINRFLERG